MESGSTPQLPPLVQGQHIRRGPFIVTVTDEMVRERQRQNQGSTRTWLGARQMTDELVEYSGEFQNPKVRRRFIRRVFSILTLQLIFTASFVAVFIFVEQAKLVAVDYPFLWWIALFVFLVTCLLIECSKQAREAKYCVILLILLTLSMAYLTADVAIDYSAWTVLLAAASTALVASIITCIATVFKFDLTKNPGELLIASLVLIIGILITSLMPVLGYTHTSRLEMMTALLCTFLMSLYLFFGVQTTMGGRTFETEPDQVVFATTQLYVSLMLLYRYILIFVGALNH